jgi:hypothetical protein
MKKRIYTYSVAMIMMLAILVSCSSPSQKVENAKADLKDAKQEQLDSIADYELFKQQSEERIANNEKIIADFKASRAANKKAIKDSEQRMIDELEQRNINMRKKIIEYKENGKDEWAAFKIEFGHDMDELGKAIKGLTVNETK